MEFWCTVVGENFSFPFERAEESRRRRRRRQRLGQMKRESASRHREPFQRESLCHGRFPFPPISTKIFTLFELFHAKCRGIYTIFRRIFCPRRGESGKSILFFLFFLSPDRKCSGLAKLRSEKVTWRRRKIRSPPRDFSKSLSKCFWHGRVTIDETIGRNDDSGR